MRELLEEVGLALTAEGLGSSDARGIEVVVTRYEKGIAYVRAWEELTGSVSWDPESFTKESQDVSSAPN